MGKVGRPAGLTNRQREFAKYYVEGKYSNAECARKAGYAEGSANVQAAKLLDGKTFPEVPKLIKEMRQARERRYGVTLLNQLKRFDSIWMERPRVLNLPLRVPQVASTLILPLSSNPST